MPKPTFNYSLVILAAGESKRMGFPKQLIRLEQNQFLLQHTINQCIQQNFARIYVVLGANKNLIKSNICFPKNVEIIYNSQWKKGMGFSIKKSVEIIIQQNYSQGIMFVVGDQPHINAQLINTIWEKFQFEKCQKIIASQYKDNYGSPAVFPVHYFNDLKKLKGDYGAKSLINTNFANTILIPFDMGYIDLDKPIDVEQSLSTCQHA